MSQTARSALLLASLVACDPNYIELLDVSPEQGMDAADPELGADTSAEASVEQGTTDIGADASSSDCVGSDCSACPTALGEVTCGVACSQLDCVVGLADDGTRPVADCAGASRCGQPDSAYRHCIGASRSCVVTMAEAGDAACLDGFCRATCETGPCRFQCFSGDCTLRCLSSPCELVDCPVEVVDCGDGRFACGARCAG